MRDDLADSVADLIARVVHPLTVRLAANEAQLAALLPIVARLETVDARVNDLAVKELGTLRERVAVVETRPPVPGPPGPPGKDGVSVKDLDLSYDGARRFTVKLLNDDAPQERSIMLAGILMHRGVWAAGGYEAGDVVTWSGGSWHCTAATTTGKPGESPDWVLIVKRGRDGKDARP
jgi:hypothetical protein